MKKIIIFAMLIFSLFFFCGCKNENVEISNHYIYSGIEYGREGKVVQIHKISIGSSEILDASGQEKDRLLFISNVLDKFNELKSRYLLSLAMVYLDNPIDEYKINRGVILSSPSYSEMEDCVFLSVTFSSISAFNYYHCSYPSTPQKMPLFLKKISSQSEFPLYGATGEYFKNIYLSSLKGFSFENEIRSSYHPQLIYDYATIFTHIHSNANIKFREGNLYRHVWLKEEENSHEKITLYYYLINKGMWITFALCLPIFALFVYLLVVYIKKYNKK